MPGDFDVLTGTWAARHRRLLDPVGHAQGGPSEVAEFVGRHVGRSYFAGAVSMDETTMAEPGQRGLSFRVRDPASRLWSIYWVNSRVGGLEPPVVGEFERGIGTFHGRERLAGRDVAVCFVWSDLSATGARWRQSFRTHRRGWDETWEMRFALSDGATR